MEDREQFFGGIFEPFGSFGTFESFASGMGGFLLGLLSIIIIDNSAGKDYIFGNLYKIKSVHQAHLNSDEIPDLILKNGINKKYFFLQQSDGTYKSLDELQEKMGSNIEEKARGYDKLQEEMKSNIEEKARGY